MASTYTDIGTELMTTGENAGNWGTKTNTNLKILEEAVRGYVAQSIAGGAQTTALTYTDGTVGDAARNAVIALTGTITGNQVVTVTAKEKWWIIDNQTTGAYTVQVLVSGQTGVTWATTDKGTKILYCNGTDVVDTGIASNKFAPDSADGEALGSSSKEFSDLYLADSGVIYFGNDQDTTLTHTDGTGLTLNSTNKLLFRDTGLYINSSTDGQLDLVADTEIQIAATTIDINGAIAMDGAITGATNITLSGELDAATLDISGNADIDGTTNLDAVDIDGAVQLDATFTVGADDQGYDVKFFGDTASAYMLWDTSADDLVLAGAAGIDLAGDIDVDGTANLDAVDIDGAVQIDNTITVGADDQGYDIKFFGDTASAYMLWDTSADDLVLAGAAGIDLAGDIDVDGTANLDNTDIDGTFAVDGTTISLDATTSLNIDNSNTSNGITIGTATSGVPISIGHTTSEVTINDNLTVTGTLTLGSNAELTEAELEFLDGITAGTAAASKAMVADANIDITGGRNITISGELDAATLDISGNADIDGTTNLDAVDIDGAVQLDSTFTVGVDDTGYDVKFFGATSGAYMLWDESTDDLVLAGAAKLYLYDAAGGEYLSSSGSALTIASGSAAWELPASDGSANQVLKTDGSGNLDWTSITSATVTALNNATANELVTVGATTTELDAEANLTFDGTDMLIGGAGKLQLRDTAIFINSSTDGQLDIDADTEVEITATTVDLNGILDVSGVLVAGGQISASDGTAGAPSISNTGDLNTGLLFSAADTMQFSSGGTAQFTMADGAITPVTDNDIDLGSNSLQFKNLYVNGTTFTDALGFGTTVMTLPTADGDADQILKTDGSGNIGFATSSGIGMGKAIAAALVFG